MENLLLKLKQLIHQIAGSGLVSASWLELLKDVCHEKGIQTFCKLILVHWRKGEMLPDAQYLSIDSLMTRLDQFSVCSY